MASNFLFIRADRDQSMQTVAPPSLFMKEGLTENSDCCSDLL